MYCIFYYISHLVSHRTLRKNTHHALAQDADHKKSRPSHADSCLN